MISRVKYLIVIAILITFQVICFIQFKCEFSPNPKIDKISREGSSTSLSKSNNFHSASRHYRAYDKWILDLLLEEKLSPTELPFSSYEQDFHLRLRQVLLFGVHEVNHILKGTNCSKWWANPLSAIRFSHHMKDSGIIVYDLVVEAQPGKVPLQLTVEIQTPSRKNRVETLTLVEAQLVGTSVRGCPHVPTQIQRICSCVELDDAKESMLHARTAWAKTDPELVTWRPNTSFMVEDYLTVGNLRNYLQYPKKNTPDYCGNKTKLVIFVSTAPGDITRRKAVRDTYASPEALKNLNVKVLFVTDQDRNSTIQKLVREEAEIFDDIIQADHIHSYHNLTLRYLNIFNWLEAHCKQELMPLPPWIIKTDGDYFINIPLALRAISINSEVEIMGDLVCGQQPIRDVRDMLTYYMPRYIFTARQYPPYISGSTWIIKSDVIANLLKASLQIPMIHVDDVYITGILTRAIKIYPKYLEQITYKSIEPGACELKQTINANIMNDSDMETHWKYFNQPVSNKCKLEEANLVALPGSKLDFDICSFIP